jgi:hypothetical protein
MTRTLFLSLLVGFAALLSACGPQNQADPSGDPLQAWVDAPLNNSAIPEAVYTLVFSGASFGDPIGNFDVLVNGELMASVEAAHQNSQGEAQYGYGQYEWLPPAPGNYLIEVVAHSGGASSSSAQAQVYVGEAGPDDEVAAATPTPGEDTLVAIPIQDVNCREGNSNQFDITDTLFEGEEYIPQGRGFDNLWVRFAGPVTNVNCWVFGQNLTVLLNDVDTALAVIPESILPYLNYPPTATPTFTPEPTSTPTPAPECSDGIDNDGDGRTDYSPPSTTGAGVGDRECDSAQDNDESN